MVADLPAELGIGKLLGMQVHEVTPGTSIKDYEKRASIVNELVKDYDFVYVHLKGPDEPGHDGLFELKKKRIEEIDQGFFAQLSKYSLEKHARICVTCDHSTPWKIKGHSDDPVPVLVTGTRSNSNLNQRFIEKSSVEGQLGLISKGSRLIDRLKELQ
jgi:2,3-bisphosphoglycerate-independent phosphoglycerate mutase